MNDDVISVTEAAKLLGVTRQRVLQLIASHSLGARKAAGVWLLDASDVEARAKRPVSAGRPARGSRFPPEKRRYTLMNAEYEVLDFEYDRANRHFSAAKAVHDPAHAPVGMIAPHAKSVSAKALYDWWRHRSIPAERAGIDAKLAELGLESPEEIPFNSLGLSLSDQYWIRPFESPDLKWEQINFFDNDFKSAGGWLDGVGEEQSPANTSEGLFPKKWVRRNGKSFLLKGGGGAFQVPFNEKAATLLFRRILPESEYVAYDVERSKGEPASVCENFLTRRDEYVPAWRIRPLGNKSEGRAALAAFSEACRSLGVDDADLRISKMIACDFIIANEDRHWRNFGLIRNIDTLEYRFAPLFDEGSSLWFSKSPEALRRGNFSFESKPFKKNPDRQLLMVDDIDWLDDSALDGYAAEACDFFLSAEETRGRAELIAVGVEHQIATLRRRLL